MRTTTTTAEAAVSSLSLLEGIWGSGMGISFLDDGGDGCSAPPLSAHHAGGNPTPPTRVLFFFWSLARRVYWMVWGVLYDTKSAGIKKTITRTLSLSFVIGERRLFYFCIETLVMAISRCTCFFWFIPLRNSPPPFPPTHIHT